MTASYPEFHGAYVKKHGLVILLPVRSIRFLTESVVEQLTAEWDLFHLRCIRYFA